MRRELYYARKQAGLSQAAVAELLGVAQTTVSGWERGSIAIPVGRLVAFARVVGVPAASLCEGEPGADELELAYRAGWDDCAAAVRATLERGQP